VSAPLTLVTGSEELLRDRAVQHARDAARKADPEAQVYDVSCVGLEPGRLVDLASPSLFGGGAILVVRDLQDAAEDVAADLRRLVQDQDEGVVLVLVHNGGVKGKALLDAVRKAKPVVVECKPLTWESDKIKFVQSEFSRHRRSIRPDAAAALVAALGTDLRELAGACKQLLADSEGTVDRELVERYHAGRIEVTGFKVADAAIEGRRAEALGLLRHALASGADPVPVNAAFAAGLRNLARVAGMPRSMRVDDVARDLKMPPFQVKKARAQLGGWSPDGVAAAITAVAYADEQIKGGGTDPVYALEKAVVAIARARELDTAG
jgi:DNA polymerase III subunit delta